METKKNPYFLPKVVKHYAEYSSKLQLPEISIYDFLKPQLNSFRMLDIGVGAGRTTAYFAPYVKEYIGIDFSEGMIHACIERFEATIPFAKFATCDVRDLSKFETDYFDLVLFSFNGLDNVDHDERISALKEIKRICAQRAYFCFSSHNFNCLNNFFKIRFRLHPIKFLKSLIKRKKLIAQNKNAINELSTAEHLDIYDDVYDFGLHTYYIRPSYQIEQLKSAGFYDIRVFDLIDGKELTTAKEHDSSTDSWIYYLCTSNLP